MEAAKAKEQALRAAIAEAKSKPFDKENLEKLAAEATDAIGSYEQEAARLVDLGDGRKIQQQQVHFNRNK
jgi:hypothetical protein